MMRRLIAERPFLQRILHISTILLVIITLLILANTLSHAEFQRGNGLFNLFDSILALFANPSAPEPLIFPPIVWDLIGAAFWLTLLVIGVYLVFTRDGRREIPGLVKVFFRGLLFAWIVFLVLRLDNATEEVEEQEPTSGDAVDLPFDDFETLTLAERVEDLVLELPESPSAQGALIVVGILSAIILSLLLLRWWRYRQELIAIRELPVDELRVRALQALQELRQGKLPLADVIRRCYQEMINTVQEQRGLYRERHLTPREFELRLLQIGLPQLPVQRLTRLFEQVRYGKTVAGEREKRQAIDSLEQIVASCENLGNKRPSG